jgi:acetyl-CoA carboxylase biotin carboxyl carrier protein
VEAPLTGIFYIRPAPDEEPYVQPGSHVEPDDVVGLVETMKMYNEVTADVAGTVREIVVENGSLVEAGQPLLYVEPGPAEEALDALPAAAV